MVQSNAPSLPLSMVVSMRDGMKGVVWSEVVELFEGRGTGGGCCGWSATQPGSGGTVFLGQEGLHRLLDLTDQGDDLFGAIDHEQLLSQRRAPQQATDAGEDLEVLGDAGGYEQEKELNWSAVDGAEIDASGVATENDDRLLHQSSERGAGMGQSHTVADAGAVEGFAFAQGQQQGGALLRVLAQFWYGGGQFGEQGVASGAGEVEENGAGGEELADAESVGLRGWHRDYRCPDNAVENKCSPLPSGMGTG